MAIKISLGAWWTRVYLIIFSINCVGDFCSPCRSTSFEAKINYATWSTTALSYTTFILSYTTSISHASSPSSPSPNNTAFLFPACTTGHHHSSPTQTVNGSPNTPSSSPTRLHHPNKTALHLHLSSSANNSSLAASLHNSLSSTSTKRQLQHPSALPTPYITAQIQTKPKFRKNSFKIEDFGSYWTSLKFARTKIGSDWTSFKFDQTFERGFLYRNNENERSGRTDVEWQIQYD